MEVFAVKSKVEEPHADFGSDVITLVIEGDSPSNGWESAEFHIHVKLPELLRAVAAYVQKEEPVPFEFFR